MSAETGRLWTAEEIAEYRTILETIFRGRANANVDYLVREGLFALGQIEQLQSRLAAAQPLIEAAAAYAAASHTWKTIAGTDLQAVGDAMLVLCATEKRLKDVARAADGGNP